MGCPVWGRAEQGAGFQAQESPRESITGGWGLGGLPFGIVSLVPPGLPPGEIIRGQEAQPHSRPHMAYLDTLDADEKSRCGGFPVLENFVLTAAHCNGRKAPLCWGCRGRSGLAGDGGARSSGAIPHPKYKETLNNDIMLLQLAKRAKFNTWVGTIALPRAKEIVKPGTLCSVAGWGRTSPESESTPTKLQEVDVVVMKDAKCLRKRNGTYQYYKSSTMMYVGDPKMNENYAKGDSGGPLVCEKTAQAVYTRVSTFIPWIQETMRRLQP
uniref:Peptidase S1 domain-containing protein n=1 Tax=Chrysemys picta bellii TaxID=8478 RepID=A0A8C3FWB8_CHRPI